MNYWLAGLDSEVITSIMSRLILNSNKIFENEKFNSELVNAIACEVYGEGKDLFNSLVEPLFRNYNSKLVNVGFTKKDSSEIQERFSNKSLSLEDALVDFSESIINVLLNKHKLPVFKMQRFQSELVNGLSFKYISREGVSKEYAHLIEKKKRQYEAAYSLIFKELKSYGGRFPNKDQLNRVLKRCTRVDSAFSSLSISEEEIKFRFDNPSLKREERLSIEDSLLLSILAHKRTINEKVSDSNPIPYIDGDNMVLALFEAASRYKKSLVLQEFFRGTDYGVYKRLIPNYPELNIGISACKIWDTQQFPEFDQNLIMGLKYL